MYFKNYEKLVSDLLSETEELYAGEIGTILKNERLALGLNQDFVCKDICSVSYYSRIENNLIKPSEEHINRIFKRLNKNIPFDAKRINQLNAMMNRILFFINTDENAKIEMIINDLRDEQVHYKVYLIQLIYAIYKKDLVRSKELIKVLHHYQKVFTPNDLAIYLLKQGEYYYLVKSYHVSNQFLTLLLSVYNPKSDYVGIMYMTIAHIQIKLNQPIKAIYYMKESEKFFIKYCHYHYLYQIKLLMCKIYQTTFPELAISILTGLIDCDTIKEKQEFYQDCLFTLSKLYKQIKDYQQCEHTLTKIKFELSSTELQCDILIEFIDLYIKMNELNRARSYYQKLAIQTKKSRKGNIFSRFYQSQLIKHNLNETLSVYKDHLIPYACEMSDIRLELVYRKEYMELLQQNQDLNECLKQSQIIISIFES